VLVFQSQLRIIYVNAVALSIPIGWGVVQLILSVVCFYLIATPITVIVALTDLVTSSVVLKLTICMGTTPIALVLITTFELGYLVLIDWKKVTQIIVDRANNDK